MDCEGYYLFTLIPCGNELDVLPVVKWHVNIRMAFGRKRDVNQR